jgi:hypothetical protein
MFNSKPAQTRLISRLPFLFFLISTLLFAGGCGLLGTHKKIKVPQLLTPLTKAETAQLVSEVNRLAAVHSIHGKVDIVMEDTSFAEAGLADKYKVVGGTITAQRPGKIYLVIQFSFVDLAQMASDGQHFSVAILRGDEKYKRFVKGTNSAVYPKLDDEGSQGNQTKPQQRGEKETVSALSNLRPQHLTDALLPNRIEDAAQTGLTYVRSEFYQEEADNGPRAKSGLRVVRGYYLLEEISPGSSGESHLSRRFWFDRVNGIRLARLQTFDDEGLLITDISYWDEKPFGEAAQVRLPARIEITRPHDHYKLSIAYQDPATVDIDKEFRPEVFVLDNRWQLPEVDLDARLRNKAVSP